MIPTLKNVLNDSAEASAWPLRPVERTSTSQPQSAGLLAQNAPSNNPNLGTPQATYPRQDSQQQHYLKHNYTNNGSVERPGPTLQVSDPRDWLGQNRGQDHIDSKQLSVQPWQYQSSTQTPILTSQTQLYSFGSPNDPSQLDSYSNSHRPKRPIPSHLFSANLYPKVIPMNLPGTQMPSQQDDDLEVALLTSTPTSYIRSPPVSPTYLHQNPNPYPNLIFPTLKTPSPHTYFQSSPIQFSSSFPPPSIRRPTPVTLRPSSSQQTLSSSPTFPPHETLNRTPSPPQIKRISPKKSPSPERAPLKKVKSDPKSHSSKEGIPVSLTCVVCEKVFESKQSLLNHLRSHRKYHGSKVFKCPYCTLVLTADNNELELHLQQHTEGKAFKCPTCSRGFDDQSTLNKHVRIHSGEKPFKCPKCPKAFRQSGTMHRHMIALHGEEISGGRKSKSPKGSHSSEERDSSSSSNPKSDEIEVFNAEIVDK